MSRRGLVVLVVDHTEDKLTAFIEAQAEAFGADMKPACTLIPVPQLALDGIRSRLKRLPLAAYAG